MNSIYFAIREELLLSVNKEDVNLENFNIRQSKRSTEMIEYGSPANRIRRNSKSGDLYLTALDAIHNFKAS